jgi:peptidyl-prolyl cis-trans isomerase SurA
MAWLLALVFTATAHAAVVDRIAAIVDDEVIALSEVYELGSEFITEKCPNASDTACVHEAELQVLDTLILRVLVRQELIKLELDVTDEELDRSIDQIARDNGLDGIERLKREVEAQGMAWDVYREQLTEQLRTMKFQEAVIKPRITVTDEELLDLYQRSTRDFESPPEATVQAITMRVPDGAGEEALVELVATAREVRRKVMAGEMTWDDAVAQYHSGMFTGPGGALPPVKKGDLMPALDKVVFATPQGEVAEPVLAAGTVFLIKVIEMKSSGVVSFEEAKDALRERIYAQKGDEQIQAWFEQSKKRASIKVLLDAPAG